MKTSLFAFATDLLGEGVERVLDNIERRAGADGVTLATVYHAARDVFPHNPQRRVRYLEGGVCYFRPEPTRYQRLALQPRVSRLVEDADVLADLVPDAERRGLDVHAWTVYLHADRLDEREASFCEQTPWGDPRLTELCPANPDVRAYVRALTDDIAHRGVRTVVAESLHFHPLEHGYHHERYFLPLGARTRFLLGLCFCGSCRAAAREHGVDAEAVRRFARDEVQRVFDGGEDPSSDLAEDEARGLAGGELGGYLDARAASVASLAREAAETAAAQGVGFSFLDASGAIKGYVDGRPQGGAAPEIAWRLGVDVAAVGAACGAVEAIAYAADPERVRLDLEAYRAAMPENGTLAAAMRPTRPDCDGVENLAAKLALARELGLERVDLYHYGFAPLTALDRIREGLASAAPG